MYVKMTIFKVAEAFLASGREKGISKNEAS